jgi:pimeloyl-ACP methyl ester carboxylesterase
MKIQFFFLSLILLACASPQRQRIPSSPEITQSHIFWEKAAIGALSSQQRVGMIVEVAGPLKGCVLYLEGLGDSVQNHFPLFNALANAGYRTLTFDYLGQGGSDGDMSNTRLDSKGDPYPKRAAYEIGVQAKWVWDKYSRVADPIYGRTCADSPKLIVGWSTGGLAAYKLAYENWADAVVLIAPGIIPNVCVGEAGGASLPKCLDKNLTLDQVISLRSLTSATYDHAISPHLDPIRPSSFLNIKEFAVNLVSTAYLKARFWKISPRVKGLVFLSGNSDTYVDREWTKTILQKNAPHFAIKQYDAALHEIDNEVPAIASDLRMRTIQFFDSEVGPGVQ